MGRLLFNEVLPEGFGYVNELVNKKSISNIIGICINQYGIDETAEVLDKVKSLGFEYATLSGVSWGMDDLIIPKF